MFEMNFHHSRMLNDAYQIRLIILQAVGEQRGALLSNCQSRQLYALHS
jgi:hypothetical protein